MNHDIFHIEGKPYVLIPLQEYRALLTDNDKPPTYSEDVFKRLTEGREHPVKIFRKAKGLTQEDLAKAAKISRPYLTEIETGKKRGSITALKNIAHVLDVTLQDLVT